MCVLSSNSWRMLCWVAGRGCPESHPIFLGLTVQGRQSALGEENLSHNLCNDPSEKCQANQFRSEMLPLKHINMASTSSMPAVCQGASRSWGRQGGWQGRGRSDRLDSIQEGREPEDSFRQGMSCLNLLVGDIAWEHDPSLLPYH